MPSIRMLITMGRLLRIYMKVKSRVFTDCVFPAALSPNGSSPKYGLGVMGKVLMWGVGERINLKSANALALGPNARAPK